MQRDKQAKREEGEDDDKYSQFSGGQSEGRSVASERTQSRCWIMQKRLRS